MLLTQGPWAQFLIAVVCLQSDHLACTKNSQTSCLAFLGQAPNTHTHCPQEKNSQPQLGCPGPPVWCPMDHSGLVHREPKEAAMALTGTLRFVTLSITFNHEPSVQPHLTMNHELKAGTPIRRAFQVICSWKEREPEGNRQRQWTGGSRRSEKLSLVLLENWLLCTQDVHRLHPGSFPICTCHNIEWGCCCYVLSHQ